MRKHWMRKGRCYLIAWDTCKILDFVTDYRAVVEYVGNNKIRILRDFDNDCCSYEDGEIISTDCNNELRIIRKLSAGDLVLILLSNKLKESDV